MKRVVIEITDYEYESCITSGYALRSIYTQLVYAVRRGKIIPDGAQILTAGAYSDLCLRACKKEDDA